MTKRKIFGIDLGTTNSCIAFLDDGCPKIIPIDGDGIVPSVVSFENKRTLVGRTALNRYAAFPDESVRSVKRLMGTPDKIKAAGRSYAPEEISAMILKYLCDEAKRLKGFDVKHVVITVPAYFSDAQRRATVDAGTRAGLVVERIVNEPTAAALFYGEICVKPDDKDGGEDDAPDWRHALVYDLGGGTFDVSVLRMGEIVEVLSSTGDTNLGGDDFDACIAARLFETIQERGGPDLRAHPTAQARLRTVAERAKIELSEQTSVQIEEANIPTPDRAPCTVSLELTRNDFEQMTEHLVLRTIHFVAKALDEAKLDARDIDRVILVGGMTKMPVIAERLTEIFGDARLPVMDPDRSVALGAAIQGGIISGEEIRQILLDVTAHTLSTVALGSDGLKCIPIIPRNTPIPATRARMFYTLLDNQSQVRLVVYQGESSAPEENTLIGSTVFSLAKAAAECPVVIEYSYDQNGIIRVVAEQKGYSRKTEIRLDSRNPEESPSFTPTPNDDLWDDDLWGDKAEYDEYYKNNAINAAPPTPINFVTIRAHKMLERMALGEVRDNLVDLLEDYEKSLQEDSDNVDDVEDELLNMLDDISARG